MVDNASLSVKDLRAGYGARQVIHGIDLEVDSGSTSLLLGANGAGKSTTLGAIIGRVERSAERVQFNGEELPDQDVAAVVRRGIQLVPEGGRVFGDLSVHDNLRLGAYTVQAPFAPEHLDPVFDVFPRLRDRQQQRAGTLSGGERQMLAIGRALMASPRLILLDEPFLGLAPVAINDVVAALGRIKNDFGISMLIVEQNVKAIQMADRAYVLSVGRISTEESNPAALLNEDSGKIQESFLGTANAEET